MLGLARPLDALLAFESALVLATTGTATGQEPLEEVLAWRGKAVALRQMRHDRETEIADSTAERLEQQHRQAADSTEHEDTSS